MSRLSGTIAGILLVLCGAGYLLYREIRYREDRRRNERLVEWFRSSAGTPWQWKAKEVIYDYGQVRRAILVPRTGEGSPAELRASLRRLEDEIRRGREWTAAVRELHLPRASAPPAIDGLLDEAVWREALTFHGEYPLDSEKHLDSEARWMLLHDGHYIYFAAEFEDDHLESARSGHLYEGDALEIFIMPEERYHTYVELVLSPDGRKYTKWVSQTARSRYELSDYAPETLGYTSMATSRGVRFEGKIAFKELPGYLRGPPARSGETLRLMMLRTDLDKNGRKQTTAPVPFLYDGHNYFGYMKLTLR